jgi:hypothetical protein
MAACSFKMSDSRKPNTVNQAVIVDVTVAGLKFGRCGAKPRLQALRSAAFVAVVQPTKLGNRYDPAIRRGRDRPRDGRVLFQRQVSAGP